MGKVLVVTARKGGCGKSMTTASLGVGLARQGKRTLIIDTDNQHSLTISMGVTEPDKLPVTLTNVITDIIAEKDIDPTAGIIHHAEGIDLMPANNSLTGIELTLASLIGRETILRQYIDIIKPLYDYVLLDTGPTLDLLTVNALAAADSVIIPVAPKYLDAKGLELLLRSIAQIRRVINPTLSIDGILLTMVDKRANFTKEIISMIDEACPHLRRTSLAMYRTINCSWTPCRKYRRSRFDWSRLRRTMTASASLATTLPSARG